MCKISHLLVSDCFYLKKKPAYEIYQCDWSSDVCSSDLSYDISDAKRLRRVHRTMRGFGDALQYSVFRCDLSPAERVLLVEALTKVINHREDQIMLINLGPRDGHVQESIETLGRALDRDDERVAVIA